MLEQAGRLGPSVPIITARVASGSPLASLALSAGGAGCEQPASASASVGRRRAGRCRGRRVMAPKLAAAAAARNALRGEAGKRIFAWVLSPRRSEEHTSELTSLMRI